MEQFVESTNGEAAMVLGERLIQRREVVVPRDPGLQGLHDITSSSSSDDGMEEVVVPRDQGLQGLHDITSSSRSDDDLVNEWSLSKKNTREVTESDAQLKNSGTNQAVISPFENSGDKSREKEKKPEISSATGKTKHVKFDDLIEESDEDEDVIELEFERESKRVDTHTIHCPKCDAPITKVILRKKRARKEPSQSPQTQKPEAADILGCSSCYSVFIPSGNCFSWIRLFGNGEKDDVAAIPQQPNLPARRDNGMVIDQEGDCFSLFRIFGKKTEDKNTKTPKQSPSASVESDGESLSEQGDGHVLAAAPRSPADSNGILSHENGGSSVNHNVVGGVSYEHHQDGKYVDWKHRGPKSPEDLIIDVRDEETQYLLGNATDSGNVGTSHDIRNESDNQRPIISTETQDSKTLEVLKSVVYGGLMESIISLGVVTSAASSEATTINIITIGLANLVGGLFIIGHNLGDLKNDQSEGASNKYQELLGRKENFLLHATFAVASFLVCGLIPPATYGFAFDKMHDKDLTLVAVAVASLFCILLLAIGKTYTRKPEKFYTYITTIMYYASMAIMVSGVSYAAGDFINKLVQNFGWFETKSLPPFLTMQSTNPLIWASY